MNEQLFAEIKYLFEKAETQLSENTKSTARALCWEIGSCLRSISQEKMKTYSYQLGKHFRLGPEFFMWCYTYYYNHPLYPEKRKRP